jgi:hypothetical protein
VIDLCLASCEHFIQGLKLLTFPDHLSSSPLLSGVCVIRSLVLYVCFVDRCLSFCSFSFGHCVVCSSSIYWFWLPLWYLQTLLVLLFFFFWPLCSLFFFDIQILITSLWYLQTLLVLLFFFFWPLCSLFFFDLLILITSLWYVQTLLFTYSISYCKDNIKCDSVSNDLKCPLNNGVSIVQKLLVKLFSQQVEITLSKCLSLTT